MPLTRLRTQSLQSFQPPPAREPSPAGEPSRRSGHTPIWAPIRAPIRFAVLLAAGLLIAGCSVFAAPEQVRGNRVDPDVLAELVPGTSSRADATALLGSPTMKASFDENVWLYIGSVTRTRVARTQSIVTLDVVKLTFDDTGVLRGIEHRDLDDSLPVSVVARTTPSPGSDASIMQQLFGNIGRFNGAGGSGPTPGGGSAR